MEKQQYEWENMILTAQEQERVDKAGESYKHIPLKTIYNERRLQGEIGVRQFTNWDGITWQLDGVNDVGVIYWKRVNKQGKVVGRRFVVTALRTIADLQRRFDLEL